MGALTRAVVLKPQSGNDWLRLVGMVPAVLEVIFVPGAPVARIVVRNDGGVRMPFGVNGPGIVIDDVVASKTRLTPPGMDVGVAVGELRHDPVPATASTLTMVKPP